MHHLLRALLLHGGRQEAQRVQADFAALLDLMDASIPAIFRPAPSSPVTTTTAPGTSAEFQPRVPDQGELPEHGGKAAPELLALPKTTSAPWRLQVL